MKGLKKLGLGVAVIGALLAVAGFVAGSVFAVSGSVSISSESVEPDGSGSVELSSNVGDPGLGAWTVDITYDPDIIAVTDCETEEGGVCNSAFGTDVIRITGASANGVEGDALLGTISFDCVAEGTSDLTMALDVFADATIGNPQPIDPATINDGSFACEEQPTAPPAATATPTLGAGQIAGTGTGTGGDGTAMTWVIVALAGAGLFALTSITAVRMSTRRS